MSYRFGIEEEFFIIRERSCELQPEADESFLAQAKALTGGAVKRELLQSQIETATAVCDDFDQARAELIRFRSALIQAGRTRGLSIIAAATHPTGHWTLQHRSVKKRYDKVAAELQMLAQRNLVCGLHVHVEIGDPEHRIDVMRRALPFLPILLALSTSSPFWQGRKTGFSSYRLTSYDEMPRTGLPPLFESFRDYSAYAGLLQQAGVIPDSSYIWWAIRPSSKFPTLELRIADACTSLEDALAIAAVYRCLVKRLIEQPSLNASLTSAGRAVAKENKWRAQRFGIRTDLIDPFGSESSRPLPDAARALIAMLGPDARDLGCEPEIERIEDILENGTSADAQIAIYEQAIAAGAREPEALRHVLDWLKRKTAADCTGLHEDLAVA